jgi:hypothetical protein
MRNISDVKFLDTALLQSAAKTNEVKISSPAIMGKAFIAWFNGFDEENPVSNGKIKQLFQSHGVGISSRQAAYIRESMRTPGTVAGVRKDFSVIHAAKLDKSTSATKVGNLILSVLATGGFFEDMPCAKTLVIKGESLMSAIKKEPDEIAVAEKAAAEKAEARQKAQAAKKAKKETDKKAALAAPARAMVASSVRGAKTALESLVPQAVALSSLHAAAAQKAEEASADVEKLKNATGAAALKEKEAAKAEKAAASALEKESGAKLDRLNNSISAHQISINLGGAAA